MVQYNKTWNTLCTDNAKHTTLCIITTHYSILSVNMSDEPIHRFVWSILATDSSPCSVQMILELAMAISLQLAPLYCLSQFNEKVMTSERES